MEAYIKYKRVSEKYTEEQLQKFFDDLIAGGWGIISYVEGEARLEEQIQVYTDENNVMQQAPSTSVLKIPVTIIIGKKQAKML